MAVKLQRNHDAGQVVVAEWLQLELDTDGVVVVRQEATSECSAE